MQRPKEHVCVLVVDDERLSRDAPAWILTKRFGAEVLEAETGSQALQILHQRRVDALILDLVLPGMDGLSVLRLLRNDARTKQMEVVIASAHSYEQSVRQAIELGISDFITKPLHPAELEKRLQALMQRVARNRRSSNEQSNGRKRLLVADADPNFCALASGALAARYAVQNASSGLGILATVDAWSPDLILINPGLSGLELPFLLDQTRKLHVGRGVPVYLLAEERPAELDQDRRLAGWVPRSFLPEVFSGAVIGILEPASLTLHGAADWFQKLEPEIVSAVRQVFGMMSGIEAVPVVAPEDLQSELYCHLTLEAVEVRMRIMVELACTRSLAMRLAGSLTGVEETLIDEELLHSGIGEAINVVAGRIKECCRTRNLQLRMALPKFQQIAATPSSDKALFRWEHFFRWNWDETFQLSLACMSN